MGCKPDALAALAPETPAELALAQGAGPRASSRGSAVVPSAASFTALTMEAEEPAATAPMQVESEGDDAESGIADKRRAP